MPDRPHLLAFLAAAAIVVAIPGPSVLFTIGRALTVGRRDALLTVVGNAVGLLAQGVAVALGLGAVLAASATAYTVVKLAGAAYLVWLGWQAIRHRHHLAGILTGRLPAQQPGRSFRQGLLVGISNPKSLVFLTSLLPQFTDPGGNPQAQIIVLGALFAAIALAGDSLWAIGASSARRWFGHSPARVSAVGGVGGGLMVGLGIAAALSGRPQT
ncbi:MAG TPA: LysE family translocator [Dermatophilaceae bacterium]|nr:LysE family translocator [Dermatophilaceae bacterium]